MLDDGTSLLWIVFPIAFFDDKLTLGIVIHTDVMYPASPRTRRNLDPTIRDPSVKKKSGTTLVAFPASSPLARKTHEPTEGMGSPEGKA